MPGAWYLVSIIQTTTWLTQVADVF